jgi:hypothetical protein
MGGKKSGRVVVEALALKIETGRGEILFPDGQDPASSFHGLVAAIQIGDGIGDFGQHDRHLLDDRSDDEINAPEDFTEDDGQPVAVVSGECRDHPRENGNYPERVGTVARYFPISFPTFDNPLPPATRKPAVCRGGCPAWTRTMNNGSKGRCVTITPQGKQRFILPPPRAGRKCFP